MTAFKHDTILKMSADFKTSMKELKLMKQQIAESKVETETVNSSPAKHLLNQVCDDCHSKMTNAPVEKMPTLTGQEDSENTVLAKRAQKAGIKYVVVPKGKRKKKSRKAINTRKLEAVIKKLNEPPRILKRSFFYCFAVLKNVF